MKTKKKEHCHNLHSSLATENSCFHACKFPCFFFVKKIERSGDDTNSPQDQSALILLTWGKASIPTRI